MNKDVKINYSNTFATTHSRDYYRGKSFHYAGEWVEGTHYISDDYNIDFVSKSNTLLVCAKSHLSTTDNEPKKFIYDDSGFAIGLVSTEWDFVLAGKAGNDGRVYLPTYDPNTGILSWKLIEGEAAQDQVNFDLSITSIINAAITRSNQAADNVIVLAGEVRELKSQVTLAITASQEQTQNAINAAGYANEQGQRAQNLINSALQQSTGENPEYIMSQKATTDALNTKMDKVSSPTVGVVGILDETGNVVDSNVYLSSLIGQEDLSPISNRELEEMLTL